MSASRASTATLAHEDPSTRSQAIAAEVPLPENVPERLLDDIGPDGDSKRLIIAVDFGTTYSAVSYVALEEGEDTRCINHDRIRSIRNYPDDMNFGIAGDMKSEVPTELMYPLDKNLIQQFRRNNGLRALDEEMENDEEEGEEEDQNNNNNDYQDEDEEGPEQDQLNSDVHMVEEADMGEDLINGTDGLAIFGPRDDSDDDDRSIDNPAASFEWGYGVHGAWARAATHTNPTNQPLSRFKLLLDSSPLTDAIRGHLSPTLKGLKERGIIKKPHDVIVDFLTCLLRHTKSQLTDAGFDNETYHTEMVLCVPAIWTQKACRDMQTAMAKAMDLAGFEGVDVKSNCIENLFIVSEPEAAAAYVLANDRRITPGDTFVLLDAGGGTVDANTYTVETATPLRLAREEVTPGGGLYGSSFLNEGFRDLLHDLLDDELYLNSEGNTISGHIEKIMMDDFEYRLKRTFDCYGAKGKRVFDIPGLRDNADKGFKWGQVQIPISKIQKIFLERLEGIGAVMEQQIKATMEKGVLVEHVVLIGGFAASISLQKYLRQRLDEFCRAQSRHPIELILQENKAATAVASGAVLRACNKEYGPQRKARSSYGILRTEPHGDFPEHKKINPWYDRDDGLPYVKDTIDWVLKLGDEVASVWSCEPFLSSHTIKSTNERLLCKEVLYVSDRARESHYQLKHANNKGAEKVGEIVVDFTFLRDQGIIQPILGGVNEKGKQIGRKHYRVNYTMAIKVVDRDLQCYAIYDGRVRQRCRLNIAPAFTLGVK